MWRAAGLMNALMLIARLLIGRRSGTEDGKKSRSDKHITIDFSAGSASLLEQVGASCCRCCGTNVNRNQPRHRRIIPVSRRRRQRNQEWRQRRLLLSRSVGPSPALVTANGPGRSLEEKNLQVAGPPTERSPNACPACRYVSCIASHVCIPLPKHLVSDVSHFPTWLTSHVSDVSRVYLPTCPTPHQELPYIPSAGGKSFCIPFLGFFESARHIPQKTGEILRASRSRKVRIALFPSEA